MTGGLGIGPLRQHLTGEPSRRRTMYMAWIDEPFQPRTELSGTPLFKSARKKICGIIQPTETDARTSCAVVGPITPRNTNLGRRD